ncbi:MAG TPA: outer membrane porin, OprD family [Campylobacterales bacterium]|nr:outer membrane porin, OprD family [Campylobacterales bacterium]
MRQKFLVISLLLTTSFSYANVETPKDRKKVKKPVVKHEIRCNMTVKYKKRPPRVDDFTKVLSEGILYGRLRSNTFIFDGGPDDVSHYSSGLGGSLIYKSARYKGLSFTTGLYTSQTPNHVNKEDLSNYRYSKDTFSRHAVATGNRDGMTALTQNYLSFKRKRVELKLGRFLMESYLLKSHDTKMIPVAFEGADLHIRTLPNTKIQFAYLIKQKLRDHETFHRVLAYNDNPNDPYAKWTGNDDGAMHKGLTFSKLDAKGIDDKILVFETKNNSLKNTTFKVGYTAVPELISSFVLEGSYKFKFKNGLKMKPAILYMKQIDEGAGSIGGANLKTNTIGYDNPNSLDSSLMATRLDFIYGAASLRLGYSEVEDGGDIVAPWHAQPTGGYTRAMSRMNWYANTKTTMLRADYDFSKAGLIPGLRFMTRYAMQDFDDSKPGTTADLNVFTFDIIKRFKKHPNLLMKMRTGFVEQDHQVANADGTFKKDPSYNAVRLEMNYLF